MGLLVAHERLDLSGGGQSECAARFCQVTRLEAHLDRRLNSVCRVRGVLAVFATCVAATGCINLGHDSDRNIDASYNSLLIGDIRAMPEGHRVYWAGPTFLHWRVSRVSFDFDIPDRGVVIVYSNAAGASLAIVSSISHTPPRLMKQRCAERRVSPTQTVFISDLLTGCPAQAVADSFSRAVSPVSEADVKKLPNVWADINRP